MLLRVALKIKLQTAQKVPTERGAWLRGTVSITVALPPAAETSEHGRDEPGQSYLAEDDGLANGDAAINVAQSLVLILPVPAQHIILSNVVES